MSGAGATGTGADGRLPVVVVAGMHREARRTVVGQLLGMVPGSVALHHDLSRAMQGTVRRVVSDADGPLSAQDTPLVNDCACCALREDLVPELERLAAGGLTRLAVVELWDSVEPQGMAEVIATAGAQFLELTGVMTALDPVLVLPCLANGDDLHDAGLAVTAQDRRTVADTWARQLEYPPVLVLVEDEQAPDAEAADDEDRALLRQLHPTARHVAAGTTELARAAFAGFDVSAAAAAQHPACSRLPQEADEAGITTVVWRRRRPFHPERLYAALEDLVCAAARSRGRFWLADRPDTLLSWDAAGGALCVESVGPWLASLPDAAWDLEPPVRTAAAALDWDAEHGDRCQHLVFTSPALDREGLAALLESCLLTDAEYAAGRTAWRALPAAFDHLLDPVP
ncbi:CobW family GTP-binding protein [Actinacidiphila epipremni]|jgi:G3E family GTPase|uniref:Cobalamin biosynthesis protein CobW n=1 Tax=Actinacidiphila epipremni TaxID=2053013 RepID=A0ABX0ZS24_9ACTN|nr:GTP-binding protein [Actinacidiphila epipremni]NJP46775.1 cobalamin biosynthesis protein CobW [Actinacidiphila epipremni]